LADLTTLTDDEFVDWGHQETYVSAIGVGECAGVIIDLVATLLFEAKKNWAGPMALMPKVYGLMPSIIPTTPDQLG
jgi:hypothetical protein